MHFFLPTFEEYVLQNFTQDVNKMISIFVRGGRSKHGQQINCFAGREESVGVLLYSGAGEEKYLYLTTPQPREIKCSRISN